jgi:hypothetical protein
MDWLPDWSNEVVAVVASGASASVEVVDKLRGRCRVAVVNNSYKLAPWADLLYAADDHWWREYKVAREFAGLKVTCGRHTAFQHGIFFVDLIDEKLSNTDQDNIVMEPRGTIGRGGNSGFQLINIVTQAGCKNQIWIGFDFIGDHWHARHSPPMKNPSQRTLDKWCRRLDRQAPLLESFGVTVRLVSATSALTAFTKVKSVEDAFAEFGL